MKHKIGLPDIISLINHFKKNYLNSRLQQVYDVNSKCFLFKFAMEDKSKKFIIADANVQSLRIHETNHEKSLPRPKLPSSFCAKLRKHLNNKKLTNIQQMGMDRIIDLQFGSESVYHIILEMYDNGNLFLTDNNYKILILTRRHTFSEQSRAAVGYT